MQVNKRTAIAIVGPTCSGKSQIGIELAKLIVGEIISADARQIFKLIDIGTAKPSRGEMSEVPHHLIDILPLDDEMSAGVYAELAIRIADEVFARSHVPIFVGGSGLYLRAVIDGLFDAPPIDLDIRKKLRDRFRSEGAEALLEELRRVDPVAAQRLLPQNYKRILRALEVYYSSGKRISELRREDPSGIDFDTIQFGLQIDRKLLYGRINNRVDDMIRCGLVEEVKEILRRGFDPNLNSLQTVGYKEVIGFLQQKTKFDDMVSMIKMNTRRYAKRQMTWFSKDKRIIWIEADDKSPREAAIEVYDRLYKK
jgi:tRNA dimethylallyltransferase